MHQPISSRSTRSALSSESRAAASVLPAALRTTGAAARSLSAPLAHDGAPVRAGLAGDEKDERLANGIIRVGGIDYLNSMPVLWQLGLPQTAGLDLRLEFAVPSRLAAGLRAGELDVALVPIAAWIELAGDCVVLPEVAIASHGAVRSIRLIHRRGLADCRRVALDTSSRTSRLLTRLLFREVWGAEPDFVDVAPERIHAELARGEDSDFDAALLIGDAALRELPESMRWMRRDLGAEWTRWTGMPFVYAFWAARRDRLDAALVSRLARRLIHARDEGLLHLDEIVRSAALPPGFTEIEARHYLLHAIRFELGPAEIEALEHFFDRLADARIVAARPPRLAFAAV